jgi:hypothetical protein
MKLNTLLLLLIFSICSFIQVSAQNEVPHLIIGHVSDTSGNGIAYVNISSSKGVGATSNRSGYFQLKLNKPKALLEITHIGYKTKYVNVEFDKNGVKKDTIILTIKIEPKVHQINSFTVTAKRPKYYYRDLKTILLDYYVVDDNLRLLIKKGNRYYMRQCYENIPQVDVPLSFKAQKLYRDYKGNWHILSKDSIYQLYENENSLQIVHTSSIKDYEEKLKPCIADFPDRMVFIEYFKHNQSKLLFSIRKDSGEKEKITFISNKIGEVYAHIMFKEVINHYMRGMSETTNVITLGIWDGTLKDLDDCIAKPFIEALAFYTKIASEPIYIPAYQSDDGLIVFNHVDSKIELYDPDGNLIKKTSISYHEDSEWVKHIFKDGNRFYAEFNRWGKVTFQEIDISTGKLLPPVEINEIPNPENVKIFEGFVYFVKRNQENNTFEFFKLKLDS